MANYENKLSEWFRQVEKKAEEFRAKRREPETAQPERQEAVPAAPPPPAPEARTASIEPPAKEVPASVAPAAEAGQVLANTAVVEHEPTTGDPRPVSAESRTALFDDADVPQVEDFLSFLGKTRMPEPEVVEPEEFHVPNDQGTLVFSEGTGEPRPIIPQPKPVEPVANAVAAPPAPVPVVDRQPTPTPVPATEPPAVVAEQEPKPAPVTAETAAPPAEQQTADERWDRLPKHLQTLFTTETEEVAQRSYKTFKETRSQLIERLLDPVISLEEAARVLNVCPTTVRRYTNRGVLKCLRTAGNQRRFKLSEVLSFMENGPKK